MEEIRAFRAEEADQHIDLFEFAFQANLTEKDREERRKRFDPYRYFGVFHEEQLTAMLTVFPFQMWLHGKRFGMGGIGGVASWPEYRRQGYVGKLMRHSLQVMRERGQVVSLLAPFSYRFYRKYGWETFMERKFYTIDKKWMSTFPATTGTIKRVKAVEQISLLNELYETYASAFNGTIQRDEPWWRTRILNEAKDVTVVYWNERDEAAGYLIYRVANRVLQVKEWVYIDEEARRGIWNFIAGHDSMADKVTLAAPSDDDLCLLLDEPRIQRDLVSSWMARIVDVKPFIEQYPFRATGGSSRFVLRVTDDCASWNQDDFMIEVDGDGRASVTPLSESDGQLPYASCDIRALSMLLVGDRTASWLRRVGRLECGEPLAEQLDLLVPKRSQFLMDRF